MSVDQDGTFGFAEQAKVQPAIPREAILTFNYILVRFRSPDEYSSSP
jgi:hypothetical protein